VEQRKTRCAKVISFQTHPHDEQVLVEAKKRGATTKVAPYHSALYRNWLPSSPQAASLMDLARWWFFTTLYVIHRQVLDADGAVGLGDPAREPMGEIVAPVGHSPVEASEASASLGSVGRP
jgi:hypothetical protein